MTSPAPSERTAFTTPTLLSLKELEETTNATFRTTVSTTPSTWIPLNTPYYLRTALLLLVTATSATVSFSGVVVLGYLLATHSLTPRQLWYSHPLQLDLAGRELVSVASMLPLTHGNSAGSGIPPPAPLEKPSPAAGGDLKIDKTSRFLPPGQRMDVWLDFTVPALGDGSREPGELAYVVADLETVDGRSAARSTQPVLLKSHSATLWQFLSAPLHWTGLLSDARIVSLKVFSNYIERRDVPFSTFKLTIKSRNEASPKILSATVRVHLRVGFIRRILYHLRPHSLIALSMGAGAACAIVGGSLGAGICIAVLAYTVILRSQQEDGHGEGDLRGDGRRRYGSASGSDSRPGSSTGGDLTSEGGSELLAGMSSAGTTPRKLDLELSEDDERETGGAGGGSGRSPPIGDSGTLSPSSSHSPKEEKPWQMLMKKLPFPSPRQGPATGDDTPYVGGSRAENSDAGGVDGGSGRTELGAAGMRFRGGGVE